MQACRDHLLLQRVLRKLRKPGNALTNERKNQLEICYRTGRRFRYLGADVELTISDFRLYKLVKPVLDVLH